MKVLSEKSYKVGTILVDKENMEYEVLRCQPMYLVDNTRRDFGLTLRAIDEEAMNYLDKRFQEELEKRI